MYVITRSTPLVKSQKYVKNNVSLIFYLVKIVYFTLILIIDQCLQDHYLTNEQKKELLQVND